MYSCAACACSSPSNSRSMTMVRSPPRRGSARAAKSCTSARLNGVGRVRSVVAINCTRFLSSCAMKVGASVGGSAGPPSSE
eukprot:scaffold6472_cov63-Phaeocystis_antarctica.AAC.2